MGEAEKRRRADIKWEAEIHDQALRWDSYLDGCKCDGCVSRENREDNERTTGYRSPTRQEYQKYLQAKADDSERRVREARQKQHQREAMEREKREKVNGKARERRAKKTEERKHAAKEEAEKAAATVSADLLRKEQVRVAKADVAKQHVRYRFDVLDSGRVPTEGEVVNLGWVERFSVAKCMFCDKDIEHFSFRYPEGGAVACPQCHYKLNRYSANTH
jgi:hypothetical protein